MISSDFLVGVVTLYSSASDAFTDEHRRLIETVAQHSAAVLRRAAAYEEPRTTDALTQLPYFGGLSTRTSKLDVGAAIASESLILWVDVVGLNQINISQGRSAGNAALCRTARCIQAELKEGDLLFRYQSDEFIAVLNSADLEAASALANRLNKRLQEPELAGTGQRPLSVDVTIKCITLPADVNALKDSLATAKDLPLVVQQARVH
jgi:diguanylate cyclase (GGDEF)-like protein